MFNKGLFSTVSGDWTTPLELFEELDREFHFAYDPCPSKPTFNGLTVNWLESNYVNPPYGRKITEWLKKGYEEWKMGKTCVFLIPSRTDTKWWHDYVMKANEIRFIKGRIKFQGAKNPAPFPSCIVIFRG